MRLCLDEHYSPQIASELRAAGQDVESVKDRPELHSMSDAELLATMVGEQRALLTENVADFAPLIAQWAAAGESHFGIVYSTHKTMPRSKSTIGTFVTALRSIMEQFPGDYDFVDQVHWLEPRA